jgi:hypothetical protein
MGTVNLEYLGRVPSLYTTIPQAMAILSSPYAPAWDVPPALTGLVDNAKPVA